MSKPEYGDRNELDLKKKIFFTLILFLDFLNFPPSLSYSHVVWLVHLELDPAESGYVCSRLEVSKTNKRKLFFFSPVKFWSKEE